MMSANTPAATTKTEPTIHPFDATELATSGGSKRKVDHVGDIINDVITDMDPQLNGTTEAGIESTSKTPLVAKMKVLAKKQGLKNSSNNPGSIPNNVRVASQLASLLTHAQADTVTAANLDKLVKLDKDCNKKAKIVQAEQIRHDASLLTAKLCVLLHDDLIPLAKAHVACQALLFGLSTHDIGELNERCMAGATVHCAILSHEENDHLFSFLEASRETISDEIIKKFLFRNERNVVHGASLDHMLHNAPVLFDENGIPMLAFGHSLTPPENPITELENEQEEEQKEDDSDVTDNHNDDDSAPLLSRTDPPADDNNNDNENTINVTPPRIANPHAGQGTDDNASSDDPSGLLNNGTLTTQEHDDQGLPAIDGAEPTEPLEVPTSIEPVIQRAAGQLRKWLATVTCATFNKVNTRKKCKEADKKMESAFAKAKTINLASEVENKIGETREKSVPSSASNSAIDKRINLQLAKSKAKDKKEARKKSLGGGKGTTTAPSSVRAKNGKHTKNQSMRSRPSKDPAQGNAQDRNKGTRRHNNAVCFSKGTKKPKKNQQCRKRK